MTNDREKTKKSVLKNKRISKKTSNKEVKRINIALQGGGSHGAYTWGVLDSILEDERISIEGLSGTSAGGMNATAVAMGIIEGGNEGARHKLKELWTKIGSYAEYSPIQRDLLKKWIQDFKVSTNPGYLMMKFLGGILSPYQMNSMNVNILQEIVSDLFDFKALKTAKNPKLFLCATNLATGKLKVFKGGELTEGALLASSCVPTVFKAQEVHGEFYWDGGFIGNPPIYPLIYDCESPDILIIQIRRTYDPEIPTTIPEILKRLGEITQNSCLVREIRVIDFISKLIDQKIIHPGKMKRLHVHMVKDDNFFGTLERESAWCIDPDFLEFLYNAGRKKGKQWLKQNFDNIGKKTTAIIEEEFS